jgi:hypothetical protein
VGEEVPDSDERDGMTDNDDDDMISGTMKRMKKGSWFSAHVQIAEGISRSHFTFRKSSFTFKLMF